MMDCDTTGIEPDIALVKYKKLVGGGMLKIVNGTVPRALKRLGYDSKEIQEIVEYLDEHETIEGAPHLADGIISRCSTARSSRAPARARSITGPSQDDGRGAAVHLGRDLQDHQHAGRGGGRRSRGGLRHGVAARAQGGRDLSRRLQAHAAAQHRQVGQGTRGRGGRGRGARERACRATSARGATSCADERKSITHKFDIAGHEGYITVGMYEDGTPGEIFIVMNKQGSTISGVMDSFATAISFALQYGVPLQFLVDKFAHMRFEPSGFTKNPQIPYAKSIVDYLFRWLASKFLDEEAKREVGVNFETGSAPAAAPGGGSHLHLAAAPTLREGKDSGMRQAFINQADAPPCPDCGASWCATAPATNA